MKIKEKAAIYGNLPMAFRPTAENRKALEKAGKKLHKSKSYLINQAVNLCINDILIYEEALERLHDPNDKIITSKEMWKRLGHGK